jgi:uncharacterized protein (TIGR00730 family)
VCVFCGSSPGRDPAFGEAARATGRAIAAAGLGLVYGGGNVGLMGEVARAALEGGAEVIGVIPDALVAREIGAGELEVTRLEVVGSMHERKALMNDLSDAFVALPGGLGTLEELFEVLTWAQLGLHAKPVGLLQVNGFFDPLLALIDHATAQGFVPGPRRRLMIVEHDPDVLLEALARHRPPPGEGWPVEP